MSIPKVEGTWIRDRRCDCLEELSIEQLGGGFILSAEQKEAEEAAAAAPPVVQAAKAWEAKHGRLMTVYEAGAFGQAWDAFCVKWREESPRMASGSAPPISTERARDFGAWVDLAPRQAELVAKAIEMTAGTPARVAIDFALAAAAPEELALAKQLFAARWGEGRWESTSTTMHAIYLMRARAQMKGQHPVDVSR